MNRYRHRSIQVVLLALIALTLATTSGCAVWQRLTGQPTTQPSGDPVVVDAQRALRASFSGVDAFVAVDDANRETLKAQFPAVHQFAETLRVQFPAQWRAAWATLDAYQKAKTPASGDALADSLKNISAIADQARAYLIQLDRQSVKAKPGAKPAIPAATG
jgi:hypothetical protein